MIWLLYLVLGYLALCAVALPIMYWFIANAPTFPDDLDE